VPAGFHLTLITVQQVQFVDCTVALAVADKVKQSVKQHRPTAHYLSALLLHRHIHMCPLVNSLTTTTTTTTLLLL